MPCCCSNAPARLRLPCGYFVAPSGVTLPLAGHVLLSHVTLSMVQELWQGLLAPRRVKQEEEQLRAEATAILAEFGERLTPRLDQPAYNLSYANRRRVEIARALLLKPRLLLLDEPTAGMNPAETDEMLAFIATLKARGQTILLIEHSCRWSCACRIV